MNLKKTILHNALRDKVCIIILMFSTSIGVAQESVNVYGRVFSLSDNPISNTFLSLSAQDPVESNPRGEFSFSSKVTLPTTLYIQAMGYNDKELVLTAENYNEQTGLIIRLDEQQYELDEVLVTIRRDNSYVTSNVALGDKFYGRLKDIPQSVSLVSRELIEDKQAFSVNDVVQDLAGVTLASSYDDFIIRGFKSGYETGVRLVNGLRSGYGYGNSYYRSPMTINLESIQILKGPGASLFGDVTPGGTVNMVTKRPLEEFKGFVNFGVGSFDTYRTTLDIGGPLNKDKTILYRLNAGYENSKTFRDINEQTAYTVTPSFTFKPSDKTQVDVDLVFDKFNGYLDRGMGIKASNLFALPRSFTLSQPSDFYNSNTVSISARLRQYLTQNLTLNISYMKSIYKEDVNEHRTLNTFADAPNNTIMNLRFFDRHGRDYTDNAVAYLKWGKYGKSVDHHIVAGIDFANYRGGKDNQLREARSKLVDGVETPLTFDLNNPTYQIQDLSHYVWRPNMKYPFLSPYKSTGVYVQDQMHIGHRLKVIAGIRHETYSSQTIDGSNVSNATQNVWLPRLGLTYEVNDQINYFASYSQGFVPVGANMIENYQNYGASSPFKAERSFQIETGLKTAFLKNQLQVDVSFFDIERQNMLISSGHLTAEGFPEYRQGGKVTSKGIEFDIRGQISTELQIMGNYTFNKTKVDSSSIESEIGLPLPGAPENMASLWMKYVFSQTALKGLGVGAGVYFVDQRRMDSSVGKTIQGVDIWDYWPSYTTVNAALYYHIGNLQMAVNLNNIFDKYYFYGGFDYTRAFPGAPRNIMVSLGYHF